MVLSDYCNLPANGNWILKNVKSSQRETIICRSTENAPCVFHILVGIPATFDVCVRWIAWR